MPKALDSKAVHGLVGRAVTDLADSAAAKKVAPSLEAALNLARETVMAGSSGKGKTVINSVKVSVGGSDGGGGKPVTTVSKTRQLVDSGPKKRVPIRTGGGTCFTVKIGNITVTVCIEWESAA
jgi:hypothetical protein